jgi:hypothetical protein
VIDELRLAWSAGSFCQVVVIHHHIDQGAFAHITPANESKLRAVCLGAFIDIRTGNEVIGLDDIHNVKSKLT